MTDNIVTLTGANGDTITFDNETYILTKGTHGFGIPTAKLRIQESAGDGGIFRHSKRGIREVDLRIVTMGDSRAIVETNLRRLANILQNTAGATKLTVTYADATAFYLNGYYAGGGETTYGEDAGQTWAVWMVVLQVADPYWQSITPQTFTVVSGSTGRGLLPKLSSLKLTSSQAVGTVTVNNTLGDVPSFPIWTVYGPLDNLTISAGTSAFTYSQPIPAGDTLTIDTFAGTVVNAAGVNKYANLASAPKLFALPPGTTSVYVAGDNATSATQIACTYFPRREVLH